jgi:hypothetical protein
VLAAATTDAAPYLILSALCLVTLWAIAGYKRSAEPVAAER